MDYLTWEEHLYNEVFTTTYDALIADYKEGKITIEELETNINECQITMLNASTEGAARFQHCVALIDAHQYALAIIQKENNL